ncbi:MAG: hypothetical protein ACP5HQ_03205 [Thermoprotei archaeon]
MKINKDTTRLIVFIEDLVDKLIEEVGKENRFLLVTSDTPLEEVIVRYGNLFDIAYNLYDFVIGEWKVPLRVKYAELSGAEIRIRDLDLDVIRGKVYSRVMYYFSSVYRELREFYINAFLLASGNTVYVEPVSDYEAEEPDVVIKFPDYDVSVYLSEGGGRTSIYTYDSNGNERVMDYFAFRQVVNGQLDAVAQDGEFEAFVSSVGNFARLHGVDVPDFLEGED